MVFPIGTHRPHSKGYVNVKTVDGWRLEHILIVERALGHSLPAGAEVHHVNEDKVDNRPSNLVVLQDLAAHKALHQRRRIQLAGGDPWIQLICCTCKAIKHRDLFVRGRKNSNVCLECQREVSRNWRAAKRQKAA